MMRWWWFGPAVARAGLDREMQAMKAGGIGGFEVQPVYPVALDDPARGFRNLPFLSSEFLDMLKFIDFGAGTPTQPVRQPAGMRALLEGPIREAAVVEVNGRRAGSVWCPPYSLDITSLLKAGKNQLRVTVANTAINHLAGERPPDYRLLNLRYGVRFEPQNMNDLKPIPSGLLGPVRLLAFPKAAN